MKKTQKLALNMVSGIFTCTLLIILNLVSRSVFNKTLGISLVGIDTLFKSVISFLSLLELGVGAGLLHKLYKPLAKGDNLRIAMIMRFYKRCYRLIIGLILAVGIIICFFVKHLVTENYSPVFLGSILLLYVIDTAVSFFQGDKRAVLIADQKNFYINIYHAVCQTLTVIFQIVLLRYIVNSNMQNKYFFAFAAFAFSKIVFRIAENLFVYLKFRLIYNRKFDTIAIQDLPKTERVELYRKIEAMLFHKIRWFAANMFSPIVISTFVSSAVNGIYGNYTLITSTLLSLTEQIYACVGVNFGEIIATENRQRILRCFNALQYFNFFVFSLITAVVFCVINPFIRIWIGKDPTTNEYMLFNIKTLILLCVYLYIVGMRKVLNMARDSSGLYKPDRYFALAEAVLSISLSLFLAKPFGVNGVIFANILAMLVIPMWTHPRIIYKYVLHQNLKRYYVDYIIYFMLTLFETTACAFICYLLPFSGIVQIIANAVVCVVVCFTANILLFLKTDRMRYIFDVAFDILKGRKKVDNR